jgi:VanZ family protein
MTIRRSSPLFLGSIRRCECKVVPGAAPLRFLRLWQTVGVLLIGFVVYLSLAPYPIEVPVQHGDKYGHILAYATLMYWYAQIYPGQRTRMAWAATFVAMGIGLEFLQRLTDYRAFETADMLADALGVGVGWLGAPPRSPHALRYIEARWRRDS